MSFTMPVPTPVLRIDDRGATLPLTVETPQGFLSARGVVSRAGVYQYRNDDGSQRLELRPEEEVLSPASLKTFEGASITDGHRGLVSSSNVRSIEVGTVMGPGSRVDGDKVEVPLLFKDSGTISKIKRGKRQLSPGYLIDLEEKPGVHPKYGRYDAIQRNIRVNHVALVDQARGGDDIKIRMDAADGGDVRVGRVIDAAVRRGVNMNEEEQIRSLKAQLAEAEKSLKEREDSVDTANGRADRAEAAVQPLRDRIQDLETKIASGVSIVETEALQRERSRADEAEEAVRRFDERLSTGIRERANLMHRAATVMGSEFRMDDMTDRQIQVSVIQRLDSTASVGKELSNAYVAGTFETLLSLHARTAKSLSRVSDAIARNDHREAIQDKQAERTRAFRDQWKKPLPNDIRASRGEGR